VNALIFMIPISLLLSIFFLIVFFWATSQGQFDDLETPSLRIIDQENNLDNENINNNKKEISQHD